IIESIVANSGYVVAEAGAECWWMIGILVWFNLTPLSPGSYTGSEIAHRKSVVLEYYGILYAEWQELERQQASWPLRSSPLIPANRYTRLFPVSGVDGQIFKKSTLALV